MLFASCESVGTSPLPFVNLEFNEFNVTLLLFVTDAIVDVASIIIFGMHRPSTG